MTRFRMPFMKTNGSGQSQSRQPSSNNLQEAETLSASVDIADIIEDLDGTSRRSGSASLLSTLNNRLSQSYLSFSGAIVKDDETSFYSALHDGFSLDDYDQYELANESSQAFERDSLWARDPKEKETMLPNSRFKVTWQDLSYEIKPKISFSSVWYDLDRSFKTSLHNVRELFRCNENKSYDLNEATDQTCATEPIRILQQVSGCFESMELTAVIGPSGAGKTSLLNFLSRRREDGFTGQLHLENSNRRVKICAIPQEDNLPMYLTVKENLMFASKLKNTTPNFDHERIVDKISALLGLDECLNTRTKSISGGQHKRLAIAQELVSKPDILILDEPTSGLDSLTCFKTVSFLKDLVTSSESTVVDPISIVLTIHQPQHEVFDLFDKIYVMATGGVVIYDGPPSQCLQFVERCTGIKMPDTDYNPASFLIELASGEYGQEPIKLLADQVKLHSQRRSTRSKSMSSIAVQTFKGIRKGPDDKNGIDVESDPNTTSWVRSRSKPTLYIDPRIDRASTMNRGNFWLKTRILIERCWKSILRDPKRLVTRILLHILLPIGLAMLMGSEPGRANACPRYRAEYRMHDLVKDNSMTGNDVQQELIFTMENVGTLFVLVYALISANIAATTLTFTLDIQNSLKEYHNGWYTMPSYIISHLVTNIPLDFTLPALSLTIGYILTEQNIGDSTDSLPLVYRVILTALAVTLGSMVGQLLGMIFGAIYIGHVTSALFVSQGACLPFVLLSGFIVRTKSMPSFVYWLSTLSFFRHILEITFILRWGFNVCRCDPTQFNGLGVRMVGVPEELRSFMKYSMAFNSEDSPEEPETTTTVLGVNATSTPMITTEAPEDPDLFQTIAKQVSLFNTYGIEVNSCADLTPYQLHDYGISEKDLLPSFLILTTLWLVMIIALMLTVKFVIQFRTSL